jgi:hypothetical protein
MTSIAGELPVKINGNWNIHTGMLVHRVVFNGWTKSKCAERVGSNSILFMPGELFAKFIWRHKHTYRQNGDPISTHFTYKEGELDTSDPDWGHQTRRDDINDAPLFSTKQHLASTVTADECDEGWRAEGGVYLANGIFDEEDLQSLPFIYIYIVAWRLGAVV